MQELFNAITASITDAVAREETVTLIGFGTFEKRHRAAHTGTNPQTGETTDIEARSNVFFKAGQVLKGSLNAPAQPAKRT
ncbi:HU family DNA-binding protein [Streptomyces sp. NPDC054949]